MIGTDWIGVAIALGGIILQAGVAAGFLHVLRNEVKTLRDRAHAHAQMLSEHDARLDLYERDIERIKTHIWTNR